MRERTHITGQRKSLLQQLGINAKRLEHIKREVEAPGGRSSSHTGLFRHRTGVLIRKPKPVPGPWPSRSSAAHTVSLKEWLLDPRSGFVLGLGNMIS